MIRAAMVMFLIVSGVIFILALTFYLIRRKYQRVLAISFAQPAEPIIRAGASVVAYHPEAREIGEMILRSGGNAFDAFVATVVAENVLAEGATSLAGSLGVLAYHAQDGQISYLDADFNTPIKPTAPAVMNGRKGGKSVLVPGAPAGLEMLAKKYGTIPLSELMEPAIALAENGFQVNRLMAAAIKGREKVLKRSSYGRATFFRGGKALKVGDKITQEEVAAFLRRFGREGASYVYNGEWGTRFLNEVEARGGFLTTDDLSNYRAEWRAPRATMFEQHTIQSSSGNSYGGLWVLLALKTLEHANLPATPYYWEDPDLLELMIRISHQVWSEPNLFDYRTLSDAEKVQSLLTVEHARSIWERVRNKAPLNFMGLNGSHSYQIITTDKQGNIANGTTTINSGPWGDGIFVEGIPLTAAGRIPWNTEPGQRRLGPFSLHLAFRDGQPHFAVGSISNSVAETSFQLLVKLIKYDMPSTEAVMTPRFGTFPDRATIARAPVRLDRNWLDPRINSDVLKPLKSRGLNFQQSGLVDTGLGVVMRINSDRQIEGTTVPVPYFANPFGY